MNKYIISGFSVIIFILLIALMFVSVSLEKQKTTTAILTNNLANANVAITNQNQAILRQQTVINTTKLERTLHNDQISYVFVQNATCQELLNETHDIQMNVSVMLNNILEN